MKKRFFPQDEFNDSYASQMASANDVYALRKKSGIEDYILAEYDFTFISDDEKKLEDLSKFLSEFYKYKIREIKLVNENWQLDGDATAFPVDDDNLMYWALDLYCKGFEFDCRLDGYGAVADFNLGFPKMEKKLYEYYFDLGLEAYNNRNLGMAIINWTTAIKIDPNDPNTWYSRAIAKDELHTWKAARRDYDKAIELAPNFTSAIVNRAANKDEAGDYDEAIEDYSKVIELEPNNEMAYFNRGNSKFNKKDQKGACADWIKAKELGATYAEERLIKYCK